MGWLAGWNTDAIDVNAVGGVGVLDPVLITLTDEARVMPRNLKLWKLEIAVFGSAYDPGLNGKIRDE